MKKSILLAFAIACSVFVNAQLVEVHTMQRVVVPADFQCVEAIISPTGTFAVVGEGNRPQLTKVDFATGELQVITTNGDYDALRISPDGKNVVFRTNNYTEDHLRYIGVNSVNIESGEETVLIEPTRNLQYGVAVANSAVTAVENDVIKVKPLGESNPEVTPLATIYRGNLNVTVNGETKTINPQGTGSYLWPSISPDGNKVLYYFVGEGAYICNLDGSNAQAVGDLRAASWLGNELVVGMEDTDDGHNITESYVVVRDFVGTRQVLTTDATIALYPSASLDGKRIIFTSSEGELFLINLK